VEWDTIKELSKGAFDVFVNFPIMAVNRALLPTMGGPSEEQRRQLNKVMGNDRWLEEEKIYIPLRTLFGEIDYRRGPLPAQRLARRYEEQLRTLFKYVSRPVIMRNSKWAPLYALFLASNNRTAVNITNQIFERYERLSLRRG